MSSDDTPYSPPAGSPSRSGDGPGADDRSESEDRLPPPVFTPVVGRRPVHRSPHLPPAGSSLPPGAVFGPDDPPRPRDADRGDGPVDHAARRGRSQGDAREERARVLATLLDRLAEELRTSGTLRFVPNPGSDTIEAALRGFLSGVLLSGARRSESDEA